MLKRNVILGGLIAGAFLLPVAANAGRVTGQCVNCHTMHNSQGNLPMTGATTAGSPTLLKGNCAGCHTGGVNDATGREAAGTIHAPQVTDSTNILSGGYFNAISDATHHNVANISTADVDGALGNTPPGGAAMGGMLTCEDCHQGTGGHHGTGGGFRLLSGVTGTPAANYGVNMAAANGVGNRSAASYNGTINTFCGSCHSLFHGAGNQMAGGSWIRHPTDITLSSEARAGLTTYSTADAAYGTKGDIVPVGDTDLVLCLSCHVPHGSANADLLSFAYSSNSAGDGSASNGCETCHSYGATGM